MPKGGLQRKVGPLKMYQWIGLGVIAGLGVLLWRRAHPSTAGPEGEVFGGTGTGAFGAIDPETGVPYAFEGGSAGGSNPAGSLADQLGGLGELIGTLRELDLWPEPPSEAGEAGIGNAAGKPKHPGKEHKRGAKQGKGKGKGKHPATSTGAGAHAGGHSHTSAPHPKHRIGVGKARAVTAQGHAVGHTPSHKAPGHSGGRSEAYQRQQQHREQRRPAPGRKARNR